MHQAFVFTRNEYIFCLVSSGESKVALFVQDFVATHLVNLFLQVTLFPQGVQPVQKSLFHLRDIKH